MYFIELKYILYTDKYYVIWYLGDQNIHEEEHTKQSSQQTSCVVLGITYTLLFVIILSQFTVYRLYTLCYVICFTGDVNICEEEDMELPTEDVSQCVNEENNIITVTSQSITETQIHTTPVQHISMEEEMNSKNNICA